MSKKLLLISILVLFTIMVAAVSVCGISLNNYTDAVLSGDQTLRNKYVKFVKACTKPFSQINSFVSALDSQNFVILLQNNREIRTTGGFIGSFAYLDFESGVLNDWYIQDIYEPDGQIDGYVKPPYPIEQAFRLGTWRLPNSNWDLDYRDAARDVKWFLEKGKINQIDVIVAINLNLVTDVLAIVGPIKPMDYPEVLGAENFYITTQSYSENDFFPGTKAKRNYLTSAGSSLITTVKDSGLVDKISLARLILKNINGGEVLAWSESQKLQTLFEQSDISGDLGEYKYNYIYNVENNLGVNKANCCIEREMYLNINTSDHTNTLQINWDNNNLPQDHTLENYWGGDYVNYHQVVVPIDAVIKKVIVNGVEYKKGEKRDILNPLDIEEDLTYKVSTYEDFTVVGFWVVIKAKEKGQAVVEYKLPKVQEYQDLVIKKQPGINEYLFNVFVNEEFREAYKVNKSSYNLKIKI